MNPFPTYIHEQLEDKLKDRRVVVWYDANQEFTTVVEGLPADGEDAGLKRVVSKRGWRFSAALILRCGCNWNRSLPSIAPSRYLSICPVRNVTHRDPC